VLIKDVADSPRIPERPAIKSRTAFIFGPSNELTNDEPTPEPAPVLPELPADRSMCLTNLLRRLLF